MNRVPRTLQPICSGKQPAEADSLPAIKHYFKARLTRGRLCDIIDHKEFVDLAAHPSFTTVDFRAVPPKYRDLVPDYIKDYVPLNQVAA